MDKNYAPLLCSLGLCQILQPCTQDMVLDRSQFWTEKLQRIQEKKSGQTTLTITNTVYKIEREASNPTCRGNNSDYKHRLEKLQINNSRARTEGGCQPDVLCYDLVSAVAEVEVNEIGEAGHISQVESRTREIFRREEVVRWLARGDESGAGRDEGYLYSEVGFGGRIVCLANCRWREYRSLVGIVWRYNTSSFSVPCIICTRSSLIR
jgi:hypothetical protein